MLWTRKPATFPAIEVRSLLHPTAQNVPLVCNRQPLSSPTPPGRASPPGTPRAQSALENASPTHEALERSSMSSNAPPEEAEVGEIDSSTARRARLSRTRTKSKTSRRPHICSICPQSFTRAEHLIRHERSHRNEKPFACEHCTILFSRKDLIKRHMARYHRDILDAEKAAELSPTSSGKDAAVGDSISATSAANFLTGPDAAATAASAGSPAEHSERSSSTTDDSGGRMTRTPRDSGSLTADLLQQFQIQSPSYFFGLDVHMNDLYSQFTKSLTPQSIPIDFSSYEGFTSNLPTSMNEFPYEYRLGSGKQGHSNNLVLQADANSSPTMAVSIPVDSQAEGSISNSADSSLSSISLLQPQPSSWRGSFEVSEEKRSELTSNVNQVFCLARVNIRFKLPSCIALERYIIACFDSFLVHMPCIHIPTWRAGGAHPSLLFGMAALGANYYHERELAFLLHRAARLSIINYMELSTFTSKDRPAWVMQSMVLTMAFGTWSGKFDNVQEALSFQANLANVVRYVKHPSSSWGSSSDDSSLSWEEWVAIEEINRTKLTVFSFLSNLNLAFNIPPALVNSEVNINLPCTEGEWTAATPQAWAEYRKHLSTSTPAFSEVLNSLLSPLQEHSIACSAFGSYIMIHALLQHIWLIRLASPHGLSALELALQKWQAVWEANSESSLSPQNPYGPLAFNTSALLRLAYVKLCVDFSRIKSVVTSQNVDAICSAMKTHMGDVQRSPASTSAALYAVHALTIPLKLGINLLTRTGSLAWGLEHDLYSFECCLFLSKWLEAVHDPSADLAQTEDERRVDALVTQTLAEVDLELVKLEKPKSAQVMYAWALMLKHLEVWGIISVIGSSFQCYADTISRGSESVSR